jgi:hypothetical protein
MTQCTDEAKKKRFRLTDARGCRRELASLYAEYRNGKITGETAKTSAYIVRALLEALRIDELEARLTTLEGRA